MRRLPAEVQHVQVALDPAGLLAHRFRFADAVGGHREPLRAAAKCGATGQQLLSLMSVQRADELEAEPCEHEQCFGPDLARPAAEWRTLVARTPPPAKRRARAGASA